MAAAGSNSKDLGYPWYDREVDAACRDSVSAALKSCAFLATLLDWRCPNSTAELEWPLNSCSTVFLLEKRSTRYSMCTYELAPRQWLAKPH